MPFLKCTITVLLLKLLLYNTWFWNTPPLSKNSPTQSLGAPATQMAMVQRCSCNAQPNGLEILTYQRMNTVMHWCFWFWIHHQSILPDEYKTTFGQHGCEKSVPPPSSENKICEKFHEQINQLRKDSNNEQFDENFVKEFLERGPTESLLIATNEIRFGRFFDRPQF